MMDKSIHTNSHTEITLQLHANNKSVRNKQLTARQSWRLFLLILYQNYGYKNFRPIS